MAVLQVGNDEEDDDASDDCGDDEDDDHDAKRRGTNVRDDLQDVPGCIAGIWGTDRGDFVALGEGLGGPSVAFGLLFARAWELLGGLGGALGSVWWSLAYR